MNRREVIKLNRVISRCAANFKPPEDLTVAEWADKYRWLSSDSSAEAGPWRTSRTPYLREPMESFTDPKVRRIVMVAASQVGKSEMEMNFIGYIIDQDPGSILFVQPTLEDAKKFSRLRIAPMIRDCRALRAKVSDVRTRDSGNTILQKSFPGGMLTITGSNSASALASTPARYIIGDERDRWAVSAGTEGDPWALAKARQATFYNAKAVEVSTPTVKGASNIEDSFYQGTQERWCHQCPECEEYSEITFDKIKFKHHVSKVRGKDVYTVDDDIYWICPECGCMIPEHAVRKQPAKWIAENPDAYEQGVRSFWLNAFSSPWTPWKKIALEFLQAHDDPQKLQVVYNTLFGQLWENRAGTVDEDALMGRREFYGTNEDGTPVELPDGVIILTCGMDTQDNRLEYEIVGHGHHKETWGIRRGFIMGRPDTEEVWQKVEDILNHTYRFRDGKGLRISLAFIDSRGHYTMEVYEECRKRQAMKIFPISGVPGEGTPYVTIPVKTKIIINNRLVGRCWRYNIGVDAGKTAIMSSLEVKEPGPRYCHFPREECYGYDSYFYNGLLSERLELVKTKTGKRWAWQIIQGHERNEPLDCRNYALAAFRVLNPDTFAEEKRLKDLDAGKPKERAERRKRNRALDEIYSEW